MATNPRTGKNFRVEQGNGGVWHVYTDGKRVWVPQKAEFPAGDPMEWTRAWLGKGNQPTQEMIDSGLAAKAGWAPQAPGQPTDPLAPDAQYIADEAKSTFDRGQQRQQLDTQESYDRSDLATALQRMAMQKPRDELGARESANKSGLLFSGHLGQQLGDIAAGYVQKQGDEQQSFDRRQSARDAARRALEGGASVDEAASLAALADRQIGRDTTAADAGYLAPNPSSSAVTQATGAKAAVTQKKAVTTTGFNRKRNQRYQTVAYGGKTYHVYKTGKPIPLRPRR